MFVYMVNRLSVVFKKQEMPKFLIKLNAHNLHLWQVEISLKMYFCNDIFYKVFDDICVIMKVIVKCEISSLADV